MPPRELRTYSGSLAESDPKAIGAFEHQFSDLGERLTPDHPLYDPDLHWYRLRYWAYTKELRKLGLLYSPYLNRFHFDFIANKSLNAIASRSRSHYLVACFQGALANIETFFYLLLSHPEILPSCGEPSRERPWVKSLEGCCWYEPLEDIIGSIEYRSAPPANFPVDPTRKLVASRLSILAMDFLFFHEVGHLANGHLEFLAKNEEPTLTLEEAAFMRSSERAPLDYQALEFNADSHAVMMMTREWFQLPERLPDSSAFETTTEALEALVLAMAALFLIFDSAPSALGSYEEARHPHPAVRLTNVYFGTCQLAERVSEAALKKVEAAWTAGFETLGRISAVMGLGSAIWHASEHEEERIFTEYQHIAQRFQEINRSLRPDLRKG